MALSDFTSILSGVSKIPLPGWNPIRIWYYRMLESTSFLDRKSRSVRMPGIDTHYLTQSCDNQSGIVAAVSKTLCESVANITEAQQFDDMATGPGSGGYPLSLLAERTRREGAARDGHSSSL